MEDILNTLITDINQYNDLREELRKDQLEYLPTKTYKGNCTKEYTEKIVNLYIDREFNKIQGIEFPVTTENPISDKSCVNEFLNLQKEDKNWKTASKIIKKFHISMLKASVGNGDSPLEGWNKVKSDKEVFRKFYSNRLRCSDWFKEKDNIKYLPIGFVPEFIYGIGLSTSRMFQYVTYFKPALAKYLIKKYLSEYRTIFDPFSGYSGRMIGTLASGRSYIGRDICKLSVNESIEIYNFIKPYVNNDLIHPITCDLGVADCITNKGSYECLLTCSPYGNIENWPGVESKNLSCDEWIDICIKNYDCSKYVFVTDDKITKYKGYVKESLVNTSHFGSNEEYVVVITKEERDNILNGIVKTSYVEINVESTEEYTIKSASKSNTFSNLGILLYNIFNTKNFKKNVVIPQYFNDFVERIYKKFNNTINTTTFIEFDKISLKSNSKDVLLAFSSGLDSCAHALTLKEEGYNVILFHMKNVNKYEYGKGTKVAKEFAKKNDMKYVESSISNGYKYWPENPIKNQMILCSMIDYCYDNNINKIALGESLVLTIDEVVEGINITDSKDVTEWFISALRHYVDNMDIIEVKERCSKLDKMHKLEKYGCMDLYYSCLHSGRFSEMRHINVEQMYGIKLPKYSCGCFCRKCATQILLKYYGDNVEYPPEFIDKCWKIMYDNGYSSEKRFFTPDISLNERIKNLFEQ